MRRALVGHAAPSLTAHYCRGWDTWWAMMLLTTSKLFSKLRAACSMFSANPQHRGLELNERLRHVEPHGSCCSHATLLFSGHPVGV